MSAVKTADAEKLVENDFFESSTFIEDAVDHFVL